MSAQSNILQALSESNAAYGAMRRTINQVKSQRSGSISFLLASYNAFINILQKAEEAKEFYTKLETQVNKVNSRVKSFHEVQEEERKAKLAINVKKFGGNIKLDYNIEAKSVGPKLKDFLQAGGGLKGIQPETSLGDVNATYQKDFRSSGGYPTEIPVSQTLPGAEQRTQSIRSIDSERVGPSGAYSISQNIVPRTSQFPPSAPSPAPLYSNQGYFYPANYYQASQASNVITSIHSPSTTTTTTTSPASTLPYTNFNHSNSVSNVGYNNTQPSPYAATSHSNYNNTYQQPVPPSSRVSQNQTLPNSTQYVHSGSSSTQPLGHQSSSGSLPGISKFDNIQNSQFNYPYIHHSTGVTYSTPTPSTSGSYVSQAGTHYTNLSSANQNQNFPSTSVPNSYYGTVPHYTHSNYSPNTHDFSTVSSVSSTTTNIPSSSSSNISKMYNTNAKFPDSVYNQSNISSNSQGIYPPDTIRQSASITNSTTGPWSAPISNPYITSQANPNNQNSYNAPTKSYSAVNAQTSVPSTSTRHFTQNNMHHSKTNAYQVSVSHSSVPYSNVLSTTISSYPTNYNQSYGYSSNSTAVHPTYTNHYYSQQYPSVQTTIAPHSYSQQQLPQNPTTQSLQQPHQPTSNVASTTTTSKKEGVSNLDLLSGLDISMTSTPQWSPLIPQNKTTTDSTTATTSEPETVTSSVATEVFTEDNASNEIKDLSIPMVSSLAN